MNISEQLGRKKESRLLGNCPECRGLDGLVVSGDNPQVRCELCGVNFKGGYNAFLDNPAYQQKELLEVTLEKDTMDITLLRPAKVNIPFANLIEDILNSALIEKFNLDYYFSDRDDGVCGCVNGKPWDYIALINKSDFLGLQLEDPRMSLSAVPVFDFYHRLLKRLFLEPITFRGFQYPCGDILKLQQPQIGYENVLFSLVAAIEDIGGQDFRKRVLDRFNENFPLTLMALD